MDKIWEKFVRIAEDNDGVIRTSQVEAAGISRPMLKKYMDLGKLERIRKGLYIKWRSRRRICSSAGSKHKSYLFIWNGTFFLGVVRQNAAYFRCDAASRIECYCAAEKQSEYPLSLHRK